MYHWEATVWWEHHMECVCVYPRLHTSNRGDLLSESSCSSVWVAKPAPDPEWHVCPCQVHWINECSSVGTRLFSPRVKKRRTSRNQLLSPLLLTQQARQTQQVLATVSKFCCFFSKSEGCVITLMWFLILPYIWRDTYFKEMLCYFFQLFSLFFKQFSASFISFKHITVHLFVKSFLDSHLGSFHRLWLWDPTLLHRLDMEPQEARDQSPNTEVEMTDENCV